MRVSRTCIPILVPAEIQTRWKWHLPGIWLTCVPFDRRYRLSVLRFGYHITVLHILVRETYAINYTNLTLLSSNLKIIPNYMLGDGDSFREVLCSDSIRAVQATTISGATISVIALIASIAAVYFPRAGISERVISSTTLIACTSLYTNGVNTIVRYCFSDLIGRFAGTVGLARATKTVQYRFD